MLPTFEKLYPGKLRFAWIPQFLRNIYPAWAGESTPQANAAIFLSNALRLAQAWPSPTHQHLAKFTNKFLYCL